MSFLNNITGYFSRRAGLILIVSLFTTLFFAGGSFAQTSSQSFLYLQPASGNFYKGENFTVNVFVEAGVAINAVSGNIKFDTNTLEVVSLGKSDSIINLWTQAPSFSNRGAVGNVSFEGIILNPGFIGKGGKIVAIVFRVKNTGTSQLSISNIALMANDGKGTNVAASGSGAAFTLMPARAVDQGTKTSTSEIVPTVIVREIVKESEFGQGVWDILPGWIKGAILVLVGTATVVMVLITISFGIVVLAWIWGTLRRQRDVIVRRLMLIPAKMKLGALRVLSLGSDAAKEMQGDVRFSIEQVEREIDAAKQGVSFRQLVMDYCRGGYLIIKRFLTFNGPEKNEPEEPNDLMDNSRIDDRRV